MPIVNVGALYDPDRTRYPEGAQWRISGQPLGEVMSTSDVDPDGNPIPFEVIRLRVQLLQYYRNPRRAEIDLLNDPDLRVQFALTPARHAMMLSYQFQDHGWNEAPFQAACEPEHPELPDPEGKFHIPTWIGLIDADTGILRADRIYTWPPEFAQAVRAALTAQKAAGESMSREERVAAGRAEIEAWWARYPTPAALVHAEAQIIVQGGRNPRIIRDRTVASPPTTTK